MGKSTQEGGKTMTRWGVGPVFAATSVVLALTLSAVNIFVLPALIIPHYLFVVGLGFVLMAVGMAVLVAALVQVHSAFGKGELVTNGVYAYMRDPVYAVWIVFIVPGLTLAAGIPLLAIAPFLMYWLLKLLIGTEEDHLEKTFGKQYLDYKSRVNSVLPRLIKRQRK